jgi:DNA-3-methyladenine glycosylase I
LAFDGFDAVKIALYDEHKVADLMQNQGIIRNKLKIESTISNAAIFLKVSQEFGSFDKYIWQFTGGKTLVNHWQNQNQIPVSTPESDAMSKDMKKRGFRFVGTTICYAFMQAAGMVNDHLVTCFRHTEVQQTQR